MAPFDRAVFLRTLALSAANVVVAAGVISITDEYDSTGAARLARLSAMAPVLAALGAVLVLAQHRARGELVALASLGAAPWRTGLGALLAGWLVGACALVLLGTSLTDVSALFPSIGFDLQWMATESGFLEAVNGVEVARDGALEYVPPTAHARAHMGSPRAAALLTVAPLAGLCPVWATAPLGGARRLLGAAAGALLTIWCLHAVAAGRMPQGWLVLAALPLWVEALLGHVLSRSS